jgi:hypothetical protein
MHMVRGSATGKGHTASGEPKRIGQPLPDTSAVVSWSGERSPTALRTRTIDERDQRCDILSRTSLTGCSVQARVT